jgi:hypothetical protein
LSVTRTEIQELSDPTLFTRPHTRDFSAASWLRVLPPAFPVFRWTEPTRPLELPVEQLGQTLSLFLRTNVFVSFSLEGRPAPEMLMRQKADIVEAVVAKSQLTILGDLGAWTLLNPPELPAWPADDLLTNTVVKVQVDRSGLVLTAVVLGAERVGGGSGSAKADQMALDVTRDLRFAPREDRGWLSNPVAQLTRGVLVFQWRTVPITNGVVGPTKSP